jgi:hypothetical protein
MEISYRYSFSEYFRMNCYTMPRMPFVKYLFIAVLVVNIFLASGEDQDIVTQIVVSIIGASFAVAVGLAFAVLLALLSKRAYFEQTTIVDEDGITNKQSDRESKAGWASFLKMHVNEGFIYVKMDNGCHLVIPRRAFTNKEQEDQCIEFIGTKIKHA